MELIRRGIRYILRRNGAPYRHASGGQLPPPRRGAPGEFFFVLDHGDCDMASAVGRALDERDRRLIRALREGRR